MNAQILRAMSVAVSLGAVLALSGCGGGGGTAMTPPPGNGGMTPMPAPPVPTLAESLASADNRFTPLTAAQRAGGDPRSEALTDDFRVTSISSDGAGGFHVTFVQGGVETSIHFEKGAFPDNTGGRPGDFFAKTDDGGEFWFWSRHSYDVDRGSQPRHRYFDEIDAGFWVTGERHRCMLVYGHRTGTAGLPAGTALYTGWFYTRGQLKDNPNRSGRQDYDGSVRLVADFVSSTLEGGASGIRVRRYDENGNRGPWEDLPATNRFAFENGQITGAQFMAGLTGMDSGNNALDDTLQGFEGMVKGEFYGPAAEEMGAVVSAESSAHNRILIGRINTKRVDPRTFGGERVPLSVGVERDYPARQVRLTDTATVTAIEGDGAGGFHVTYRVDGADQRVHLEASDYGSDPDFPDLYASEGENSPYILYDMSDSFRTSPDFDHFNAQGWIVVVYDANDDVKVWERSIVYGDRTEVADLPASTASYSGRMSAFGYPSDNPSLDARFGMRGNLTLMADFANSNVTGRIHDIEAREDRASQYNAANGELAISNGAISGSGFTADVAGSVSSGTVDADISGQFFGPAAAEVGGVLSGTYTEPGENVVMLGFFGGEKQ